jgi:hypothetical protein
MENRNGLVVDACLTRSRGTAEPEAALAMLDALPDAGHKTVGADKAYDATALVANSRAAGVTLHVAPNIIADRTSTGGRRGTLVAGPDRWSASGPRRRMAELRRLAAWRRPSCAG